MKNYTANQINHISNNGEFKVIEWDNGEYTYNSRIYYKILQNDTYDYEYRIGNSKAGYYNMKIKEGMTYKNAYELISRLLYMKGILKEDIQIMSRIIDGYINQYLPEKENNDEKD